MIGWNLNGNPINGARTKMINWESNPATQVAATATKFARRRTNPTKVGFCSGSGFNRRGRDATILQFQRLEVAATITKFARRRTNPTNVGVCRGCSGFNRRSRDASILQFQRLEVAATITKFTLQRTNPTKVGFCSGCSGFNRLDRAGARFNRLFLDSPGVNYD
jgi:hypothetical protein